MPASQVSDPTGLFHQKVAAGDMSGQLIESLFGKNWDSIGQAVSGGTANEAASLLLTLLAAMSTVALAIGTALMAYTILLGIVGTAHEGSPLGQKLSTIWTPIRGALSVAMLIPTAKGLSVLMVIILACLGGSLNFANYLSDKGYDYLKEHGGVTAVVTIPPAMRERAEEIAVKSLQVLAAQHYMNYKLGQSFAAPWRLYPPGQSPADPPISNFAQSRQVNKSLGKVLSYQEMLTLKQKSPTGFMTQPTTAKTETSAYTLQFEPPEGSSLRPKDMGSIVIPCNATDGGSDPVCKARSKAIVAMLKALEGPAHHLAARMMSEKERAESNVGEPGNMSPNAILDAVEVYQNTVEPQLAAIINNASPEFNEALDKFVSQARQDGWLMLGSYYWTISRFAEHSQKIAGDMPTMIPSSVAKLSENAWNDPAFDAVWASSQEKGYEGLRGSREAAAAGADEGSQITKRVGSLVSRCLGFGDQGPVAAVAYKLTEEDPVAVLCSWGHGLTSASAALWLAATSAEVLAAGGDAAANGLWGDFLSGGAAGGVTASILTIVKRAVQIVGGIVVSLFTVGLFMAYYLPALPWVLWMSSIIGWVILVVETLFAAPLWAVAHMIPSEGDGPAGSHAKQGYMLLFGILVRPPLMVAGLFCSIVIMACVGKFVGYSFLVYYSAVSAGHSSGIITWVVQSVLLCAAMVVFAHKIFGLITHLPDKVIRWVGQQTDDLGTGESENRIRGIAVAGAGYMARGGGQALAGMKSTGGAPSPSSLNGGGGGGGGGSSRQTEELSTDMPDNEL